MENYLEEFQAPPNLAKFFDNLVELKKFIKEKSEESDNESIKEIYSKLDKIFKIKV